MVVCDTDGDLDDMAAEYAEAVFSEMSDKWKDAPLGELEEYSDSATERGKLLRDEICRRLKLTSLEFQSLEGTVKAVGKPQCGLCTYCWNGRE